MKQPGKEFVKTVVNSDEGKRLRDLCLKTWDPLFSPAKGGKIDIKMMLEKSKSVKIPDKYIELYQKFADNYEQIKSDCIENPKIDTRVQSLKK